ncbi:MAG: hypothetical protein ABEH59_13905 [Halobacteriales archaeon]
MRRRRYLATLGGLAGVSSLAGCLDELGAPTPSPDPTPSGDQAYTPKELSFEVRDRECGEGLNDATVSFGDDVVDIDGVIAGRDTCDTARLVDTSLHLDVLEIDVAVVREPATDTPACAECITDIDYHLRAAGLRGGPAQVRVRHRTADGEVTAAVADRP